MGFFDFLAPKPDVSYYLEKYYHDYPRKPYISPNRNFKKWEKIVASFPNMLVSREMMTPYEDGLLPGHIRMLYWLKHVRSQKVPDYFEYEHGIDFYTELKILNQDGYVEEQKVTAKGDMAIKNHQDFINKYHPVPRVSGSVPLPSSPSGFREAKELISYVNCITESLCNTCGIEKQVIAFFQLDRKKTDFKSLPNTRTGKAPKYPYVLHYEGPDKNGTWQFGDIWLLHDGRVGKTKQVYWKNSEGYFIYFGQTKDNLVPKKVEYSSASNNFTKEIIYKE